MQQTNNCKTKTASSPNDESRGFALFPDLTGKLDI